MDDDKKVLEIKSYFFKYFKVIALNFIAPLWVVMIINEGIAVWKIFSWFQMDIIFWENKSYLSETLIIFFVPIIYIYWFFQLTLKKILFAIHHDLFRKWNKELAKVIGEYLIKKYTHKEGIKDIADLDGIIMWMNQKIASLPKWLQWVTKRLFDQIPILEFISSYQFSDLENLDEERISLSMENKINEMQLSLIDEIVPWWMILIIQINFLLILHYINL
ncbi:MAG: hypothetical protein AB8H03_00645 [Saprospiraceae bacterium]